MRRNVTLVPWTDLLWYAQTVGYTWNQAHKILVDDEIPPMYEAKTREYHSYDFSEFSIKGKLDEDGIINEYGFSEDTVKICKGFMESEKIDEMTVTG